MTNPEFTINTERQSPWLPGAPPSNQCQLPPLFCFSYAGSSAEHFRAWQSELESVVHVLPVELPGRGTRFGEQFSTTLDEAAAEIATAIGEYQKLPFAFFGHSLGAIIALEVAQRLHWGDMPLPFLFIASGLVPPHLGANRIPDHTASNNKLLDEIRRLGGTPEGVLNSQEFVELFLPIFRNDFRLAKTHSFSEPPAMDMKVVALRGEEDPETTPELMAEWGQASCYLGSTKTFSGGHFFIHENRDNVLTGIREILLQALPSDL